MRAAYRAGVLGALALGLAARAATPPHLCTATGGSGDPPPDYAPPLVSNGGICLQVDPRGGQAQRAYCKMTPGITWAGRRYGPPRDQLIPFGHFDVSARIDGRDPGEPVRWTQTLDTRSATVTCHNLFADGTSIETTVFTPLERDLIVVRRRLVAPEGAPRKIAHEFRYQFTPRGMENVLPRRVTGDVAWNAGARSVEYRFQADGHRPCAGVIALFSDGEISASIDGWKVALASDWSPPPGGSVEQTFLLLFADSLDGEGAVARAEELRERARASGFAGLLAGHRDAWERYWARSDVRLPDERMERVYRTAQYHLRANATRWSFPVGLFDTHWSGRFFAWDEAFCHQALLGGNHPDIARRMPEFRLAGLKRALYRAGHGDRPGRYGARYPWETLEDGSEGAPPGYWMDHVFHMANIAAASWLQFLYTDDLAYLEGVGYPVIRECARFFRAQMVYEEKDGETYIGRCTDLERLGPAKQRAFLTTCGVIHTLESAATAAGRVGADAGESDDWRATAGRLRASLPHDGERYIPYPGCEVDSIATLAGIFPYPIFDGSDRRQRNAVYHFVEHGRASGNMYPVGRSVCAWYAAKMATALARLGDATRPLALLSEAVSGAGRFGELFEINEPEVSMRPWFATASGTFAHAIHETLVQSRGGEIRIAAGIPGAWTDYAFRLACHGGLVVDVAVARGRLTRLTLIPDREGIERERTLILPARLVADARIDREIVSGVETRDGHARIATRFRRKTEIVIP